MAELLIGSEKRKLDWGNQKLNKIDLYLMIKKSLQSYRSYRGFHGLNGIWSSSVENNKWTIGKPT